MWRSSLDRWIVSALQRFSVGFASVLACVRDCVPFVSGAVNKCPLYAHGLNGHMDIHMAIHIHIRHHPSPCDGTVGQLCGTGEKSFLCFGFGTVWFGFVRFRLLGHNTCMCICWISAGSALHYTIPYHTIPYHSIAYHLDMQDSVVLVVVSYSSVPSWI